MAAAPPASPVVDDGVADGVPAVGVAVAGAPGPAAHGSLPASYSSRLVIPSPSGSPSASRACGRRQAFAARSRPGARRRRCRPQWGPARAGTRPGEWPRRRRRRLWAHGAFDPKYHFSKPSSTPSLSTSPSGSAARSSATWSIGTKRHSPQMLCRLSKLGSGFPSESTNPLWPRGKMNSPSTVGPGLDNLLPRAAVAQRRRFEHELRVERGERMDVLLLRTRRHRRVCPPGQRLWPRGHRAQRRASRRR